MSAGVPVGVTPLGGWALARTSAGADLLAGAAVLPRHGSGTCAGGNLEARAAVTPTEGSGAAPRPHRTAGPPPADAPPDRPRPAGMTEGRGGEVVASAVGVDLVAVSAFADQLATPGTRFASAFTDREREHCRTSGDPSREAASLAARWAAKEAFVKAWSQLIHGSPPPIPEEEFTWAEVEVVADRWNRPRLRLHGRVASEVHSLEAHLGARLEWNLSLTHDGGHALAEVWVLALATT